MRLILKNTSNLGDIEITDGIVTSIGQTQTQCDEEIDASAAIVWPGLIDSHVHFRSPGDEHKEDWTTGPRAALAGGITGVLDMPHYAYPTSSIERLEEKKALIAQHHPVIEYKLAIRIDEKDPEAGFAAAQQADAIKLYLGATTGVKATLNQELIKRIFAETTAPLMIHAEDEESIRENARGYTGEVEPMAHSAIRGREAAITAVEYALELAKTYDREIYLCHVSTKEEIELVKTARANGINVHVEVTPHHLFLNTSTYAEWGNYVKVNPPLRTPEDNEALLQATRDKVVDTIATDHAPHTRQEKEQPYWDVPSGIPGIEFMFPLLLTAVNEQKLTLDDIERCCRTNPTALFKFTQKEIKVGRPADLVLFNPTEPWVIEEQHVHSKCGWSPYIGMRMVGKVIQTITPRYFVKA